MMAIYTDVQINTGTHTRQTDRQTERERERHANPDNYLKGKEKDEQSKRSHLFVLTCLTRSQKITPHVH